MPVIALSAATLLGVTACSGDSGRSAQEAASQPSIWDDETIVASVQAQVESICGHQKKPFDKKTWEAIATQANLIPDLANTELANPDLNHYVEFDALLNNAIIEERGGFWVQVVCEKP